MLFMLLLQYAKVIKLFRKCKNFRKKSTGAFSKNVTGTLCFCSFFFIILLKYYSHLNV